MPGFTSTTNSFNGLNSSGNGLDVGRLRSLPTSNTRPPYRAGFAADRSDAVLQYDVGWGNTLSFIESMLGYTSNIIPPGTSKPRSVTFDGSSITATTGGASATITLSGHTVASIDVDRLVLIYSGTNYLPGPYTVSSVNTGANTWTLDRTCTSGAGSALVATSQGKGNLLRTPPCQHPDFPWLFAVEAEVVEGVGVPGQGARGQLWYYKNVGGDDGFARIDVTYRALDYEILTDGAAAAQTLKELSRYVSRFDTYSPEVVELPGHSLKFSSDSTPVPTGEKVFLPKKELTYIWHEVPDVPDMNIEACQGCVNSTTFDGKYPAETLLFLSPDKKRYRDPTGNKRWEITYKFSFRPQGWNRIFRRSTGAFEAVVTNTGGRKPYTSVDFAKLFEVPPPS